MPTFKVGSSLADSNRTQEISLEYSRARGYALTQVPYWTETLIFLHTVGNNPSSSVLRNTAEQLLQPSGHSLLKTTAPRPQPANEVNAVASSLLGRSTIPYQVWGTPPFFLTLPEAVQLQQREESCSTEPQSEREEGLQWVQKMLAAVLPTPQKNNKSLGLHLLSPKSRLQNHVPVDIQAKGNCAVTCHRRNGRLEHSIAQISDL